MQFSQKHTIGIIETENAEDFYHLQETLPLIRGF